MFHDIQNLDLHKSDQGIYYNWDLISDQIDWQNTNINLLSTSISSTSGNGFGHLLSPESFDRRFLSLKTSITTTNPYYQCFYFMHLANHQQVLIYEQGHVRMSHHRIVGLNGNIRTIDSPNLDYILQHPVQNFTGHDVVTGLATKDLMIENLALSMDHARFTKKTGVYLVMTIADLSQRMHHYTTDQFHSFLQIFAYHLNNYHKNCSFAGRLSGTSFALILWQDAWNPSEFHQHFEKSLNKLLQRYAPQFTIPEVNIHVAGLSFCDQTYFSAGQLSEHVEIQILEGHTFIHRSSIKILSSLSA